MAESVEPRYSELVGAALAYAADVHRYQTRKGKSEPYLSHVLKVCALVAHHGGNESQIIGGALHDAVEDQGGEARAVEIGELFGPSVEAIVRDCSDAVTVDGAEKPPWRERKEVYLQRLQEPDVNGSRLVEACDKISNLEDIVEDVEGPDGAGFLDRFSGGRAGVLWYYSRLGEVLFPQVPGLAAPYDQLLARLVSAAEG